MKLKKVAAICTQSGMFNLFDLADKNGEVSCQWLGDGYAAYPIVGMPYMGTENLCAMFDIPEKKQEKLIFRHDKAPDNINWKDADPLEYSLGSPKLCVRWEGRELLPLRTSAGITFIQEKYLAPLDNLDYMSLYERKSKGGGLYIAAKIGMMIQAVIMPMDVINRDFVDSMEELTALCLTALRKKDLMQAEREQVARDREQGTLFQENGDAAKGEGE